MSNSIYTPYTYLIGWSNLNKFYYGVRTAKNCNPNDFWVKYFTSSKEVKKFRKENGDPDIIQIRKTFKDKDSATKWESTVLRRLHANIRNDFLNLCNTAINFNTTGYVQAINLQNNIVELITSEEYEKNKGILYKHHLTGSVLSEERKLKLSECNKGKNNSQYGKYGKDHPAYGNKFSEKQRQLKSESQQGVLNSFYGKKHSEKTKCKMRENNKGENNPRYGKIAVINIITGLIENVTCEEYKIKKDIIYIHPRKGKKVSEETKRKLSEAKCGENHPCYGKIWIHNSEKCLKIFPEEFENYSNQGFIKGRKYAN